ncbi:MAG TPA: amidase [Ktedonobacterales bacterium]|jgi:amidase
MTAPFAELEEASIAALQAAMATGQLTALHLVERYLARIDALDHHGPAIRSIIETNPDALDIAAALDRERAANGPRGSLHGIPILLKDNIDTGDHMRTTAGSLALMDARPAQDATVATRLRAAGAILLGKANLSEWANFRSTHSSSGWSARGGQALNPYSLDRSPCGSSSGSASAVAANLTAAALGTETDGSIVCPAGINGVVGIKPTVGLTSRAGVIPISHTQDTVGPFGRTVADAAALLGPLAGPDPRDPATTASQGRAHPDYTRFLDADGLRGARIGIAREAYFGYSPAADAVIESAIATMRELGAIIVDPADIPTARAMRETEAEGTVLLYEFKADLNAYLAGLGRPGAVRTLAELIAFNEAHAAAEMPFCGQEHFLAAEAKGPLTEQLYLDALAEGRRLARTEGIDAVMDMHQLDALVMPTGAPAWKIDHVCGDHHLGGGSQPAALAGYPIVTVPAGLVAGLPVGVSFMGRAYSEPTLIRLAYAYEQGTRARRPPTFRAYTP